MESIRPAFFFFFRGSPVVRDSSIKKSIVSSQLEKMAMKHQAFRWYLKWSHPHISCMDTAYVRETPQNSRK